ncbi:MAG: ABC transporter permease [Treponema sp.]|nr:ABC transporter permease [Treponema sp.]
MIGGLINGLLNFSAPLLLSGLGALLSDISGALGIFIEGFMISGAFFSWVFSIWTGSALIGTLLSSLLAAGTGWALARYVRISGANPFIAGLALNLAASGVTLTLSAMWFGTRGVILNPGIRIPAQSVFTTIAFSFAIIIALSLSRTVPGLRLKASGLEPDAASDRGIRPGYYREAAWALAAFLAALAGAALTFRVGAYAPGGIAGRGWIALAAVYLGFRKVWGVALACIVFSFADRLGFGIQALDGLPATATLGLPSLIALMLYSVSMWFRSKQRGRTNDSP